MFVNRLQAAAAASKFNVYFLNSCILCGAKLAKTLNNNCSKNVLFASVRFDCHRTSLRRVQRKVYTRTYPTLLVMPNGSSITIRYDMPREIIQLPLDITKLSDDERLERMAFRKPKKVVAKEAFEEKYSFKPEQYSFAWKTKK